MLIVLGVTLSASAAVVASVVWMLRNLAVAGGRLPVTAEWIDELSVERYRPMMRLLDQREIEFLRSQPGFTPKMAARMRAQRCQIFRGYLHCLSADFSRVCAALKLLLVQSRYDRPDLGTVLLRSQALFAYGMLAVSFRVFCYRWGFGSVDVRQLINVFDGMRLELRTLVPAALPMSA